MRNYRLYRVILLVLVIVLFAVGYAGWKEFIGKPASDIVFAVNAALIALFAAFAVKPLGEEVSSVIERSLSEMPVDVMQRLQENAVKVQELE